MIETSLCWFLLHAQTQVPHRRTIYDSPYEESGKNSSVCVSGVEGIGQPSSRDESPVHAPQFSPLSSAFSIYRRPQAMTPISNSIPHPESVPMECELSPNNVPMRGYTGATSTTSSRTSSPRPYGRHNHHLSTLARDSLTVPSTRDSSSSPISENLVLEPRPNPVITHVSRLSQAELESEITWR